MKRYFIVCYNANSNQGQVSGYVDFRVNNGFLNRKKTITHIEENGSVFNVVIKNIIELTESDYLEWIS